VPDNYFWRKRSTGGRRHRTTASSRPHSQSRHRLERSEIARALGWALAHPSKLLATLSKRLESNGQLLYYNDGAGGFALLARDGLLTEAEQQTLGRARLARSGLTVRQARMLIQVTSGEVSRFPTPLGVGEPPAGRRQRARGGGRRRALGLP